MTLRLRTRARLEYVLKGVFLGTAFFWVAHSRDWRHSGIVVLGLAALLFAGIFAAWLQSPARRRVSPRQWPSLAILLLLERPATIYAVMVVGTALVLAVAGGRFGWPILHLPIAGLVGGLLGLALDFVVALRATRVRRVAIFALLASVGAGLWALAFYGLIDPPVGGVPALGILATTCFFYVLIFAGVAEETELEVGLLCLAIALAFWQVELPRMTRGLVTLVPALLYVVYCERIRTSLVSFKHVLRGLSCEHGGDLPGALVSYRRAIDANPRSEIASAGNWRVHRKIDLDSVRGDPDVLNLIDPVLCIQRARTLLKRESPRPAEIEEVHKLLDIVGYRRSDLLLTVGFERIRALLAEGRGDEAMGLASELVRPLPHQIALLPDHEAEALFRIWSASLKHPVLAARGLELLDEPPRLFSFLASLERRLKQHPGDEDARSFKPFIYQRVTLKTYEAYSQLHGADPLDWFDYAFLRDSAANAAESGPADEAAQKLLLAEIGLPEQRLEIWNQLVRLYARNEPVKADEFRRRIKRFALDVGIDQLTDSQQAVFYETVRLLGDQALTAGDVPAAIENFQLYADSPRSGLQTQRTLKELYERQGDPLSALRPVENALVYSLPDAERRQWQAEKARIYDQLNADIVRPRLKQVERFFDFHYCYRKAKSLFDARGDLNEVIRYLDLAALGGQSELLNVNYLLGRSHYRAGRFYDAALCLEAVRQNRPKQFADADQEDAFFTACRLLGDVYLNELGEPAKAVERYLIYKDYVKSGADTLFHLARAYEANGQPAHARKWYDMVLVYSGHPKAGEARIALERLATS